MKAPVAPLRGAGTQHARSLRSFSLLLRVPNMKLTVRTDSEGQRNFPRPPLPSGTKTSINAPIRTIVSPGSITAPKVAGGQDDRRQHYRSPSGPIHITRSRQDQARYPARLPQQRLHSFPRTPRTPISFSSRGKKEISHSSSRRCGPESQPGPTSESQIRRWQNKLMDEACRSSASKHQ